MLVLGGTREQEVELDRHRQYPAQSCLLPLWSREETVSHDGAVPCLCTLSGNYH